MDVLSAAASVAGRRAMAPREDELLLARAQRGERAARAALVDLYQRPVHVLVARMLVGRPGQVDDVVQDSLLKMLEALPRFDPRGPAKLSTWILTIATRTAIDVLRGSRRAFEVVDEDRPGEANPEAQAMIKETMSKVEKAMAALPDDHRAVLVLRAYHDLDYSEIAAILSIEEGTVKSRLARARAALRSAL